MSRDYGNPLVFRGKVGATGTAGSATLIAGSAVINGTLDVMRIFSKTFDYMIEHAQIVINIAATSATQTFKVQMSSSANDFATPTDLASITIASSDTGGTMKEVRVSPASAVIPAGRLCRVVHIATATDATLNYDFEVSTSSVHE